MVVPPDMIGQSRRRDLNSRRGLIELNVQIGCIRTQPSIVGARTVERLTSRVGGLELIGTTRNRRTDGIGAARANRYVTDVPTVIAQCACENRKSSRWRRLVELDC